MSPRPVIIDCDPGQDDAVALVMALARPDAIEVLAVTAVGGNVPLRLTERNARRVVELCGRPDLPVHAGCAAPLIVPLETAEYVHGETGLDGSGLPDPERPLTSGHAVDAMIDLIEARPEGAVTLVATGPLTNVALAFAKAPAVMRRLERIVLMGGALELGNVTPAAEFNVYVDPHAARMVFQGGVPITMFGLDVTHKVLVTDARLRRVREAGTGAAAAIHGMMEFAARYDRERYSAEGGPLHDPCTIAWLLQPDLFRGRECRVEIETDSPLTRGMTVVDWLGRAPEKNAAVMRDADADGFFDLLDDCLKRLG
ncbi:MAG: nucleoside hydrolase [Geminicoccaceae bacterium]|nr:nucleoside hydrolase [Geminicoccaceae bacterium]